jgi:E3 ubiquitin-protein ligase RNF13
VLVLCGILSGESLVVERPADIAGTYPHVTATFGPQVGADGHSVSGNVTIPDPADACAVPANDVQGAIVLANRGVCDFIEKVRHAQAAGATAVVVANDQGEHLFKMYSSDDDTSDVTIPSVFVTTSTGQALPGATVVINATGEYDFGDENFMHPYFFMAVVLLGLSVTLACTLTATLVGYLVVSFKKRRQRTECRRAVEKLTTRSYTPPALGEGEEASPCTICLEEFRAGDKVKALPCGHEYHRECIDPWLLEKSSLCPLCKQNIIAGDDFHSPRPDGGQAPAGASDVPAPPAAAPRRGGDLQQPVLEQEPELFVGSDAAEPVAANASSLQRGS